MTTAYLGRLRSGALLIGTAAWVAGCSRQPPAAAPGPLEVGVIKIATAPVSLTQDLPGRVNPFFVAQVDARVSGIVQKRLFTEGSLVKEGDVLYQIDPAPYEALLKSAQGTLIRAQANVISSRINAASYTSLVASGAVGKQDAENAVEISTLTKVTFSQTRATCRPRRLTWDRPG